MPDIDSASSKWYIRNRAPDVKIIDRMVTLMAVNNEFLRKIAPLLKQVKLLRSLSGFLPVVVGWIINYHEKYGRAPRAYLTKIYEYEKNRIDEVDVDLIYTFLTRINSEYKSGEFNDIDIKYELEKAEQFIQEQAILDNDRQARQLLSIGQVKKANEVRKNFVLPTLDEKEVTSPIQIIDQGAVDLDTFLNENIAQPAMVVHPWLTDGSLTMIYAPRGVGKTWVCVIIATGVTRKNYLDITVGPWKVKQNASTLYIDGEMPDYYLQERFKKVRNYFESIDCPSDPNCRLRLLCSSTTSRDFLQQINIADYQWRNAMFDYIERNEDIRLVVLDNVASLAPKIDENSKEAWDPINQWLLSLRHLGVSVMFVHHAGKSGKSRGTSGREDALDNIIQLRRTKEKEIPSDEQIGSSMFFDVTFDKARNSDPDLTRPFSMRITSSHRRQQISWETFNRNFED